MPFLLALTACHAEFRIDEDARTCDQPMSAWDGLTGHVLEGSGDGSFAYAPDNEREAFVEGFYELSTGYYDYDVDYVDGYFKTTESVTGEGYLWTDGDADLLSEVTVDFIDGSQSVYTLREERFDCEATQRASVEDDEGETTVLWYVTGVFEDGFFQYSRSWYENGLQLESEGTMGSDLSWVESMSYDRDGYSYEFEEAGAADGSFERTFTEENEGWKKEGSFEFAKDGSETWEVTVTGLGSKAEWEWTTDFSGDGEGSLDWGGNHCDLKLVDGTCKKKNCTAGANGTCEVQPWEPVGR